MYDKGLRITLLHVISVRHTFLAKCVQNDVSGRYVNAVFNAVAHKQLWRSGQVYYTCFYQVRHVTASRLEEFVWPLYKQTYKGWIPTAQINE